MRLDEPTEPTIQSRQRDYRGTGNVLAVLSFIVAGGVLLWLERWAWRDSIEPHIGLVKRIAVPAVVLSHRVEEQGAGPQGSVFPYVTYRYSVSGRDYESSIIRAREYVSEKGDEEEIGVARFDGPDRHQLARSLLNQFSVGRTVTAWVDPNDPSVAMLVQQLPSFLPFLWGLLPVLFIPLIWMMVVGVIRNVCQRPRGRWLAMGWSVLTLVSALPIVWQYRQLIGEGESTTLNRLLNVGLGIAVLSLVGSLLPRVVRSGLAIGSILSFSVFGGAGTALAAALTRFPGLFGLNANPARVFVWGIELALLGGIALGVLIAIGASRGVIWIRSDDDDWQDKYHGNGGPPSNHK